MAAESKGIAITMQSASTEYKLMVAAEHNDIDMLYQLIEEDTNVLHRMDKMDVVDTPLHMASSKGCVDFAMEMMYLKPSLAKKLNKEGLSPVHVALKCGHTELALSLLKLDKTLVGVRGRMGYTPLHYLVMYEKKKEDLNKFFDDYHPCIINDLTSQGEIALHVAAKGHNEALKCLLEWLRKTAKISMLQKDKLLDMGNRDKETVLHVLAWNQPEPQIVKLLSNDLRINTEAKNSKGQTALQILESSDKKGNVNIEKCVPILRHHTKYWDPVAILRRMPFYIMAMIAQWGYEIKTMSPDNGNAMLVVTVLILTTSNQASLSPLVAFCQQMCPKTTTIISFPTCRFTLVPSTVLLAVIIVIMWWKTSTSNPIAPRWDRRFLRKDRSLVLHPKYVGLLDIFSSNMFGYSHSSERFLLLCSHFIIIHIVVLSLGFCIGYHIARQPN
ncbi:hypothetical protein ES332_A05G333100v1 [Gossypium tomentosum]|uniref:Uncharacterized protein n=1 Tax=Gossypium tomentosum TaxID=34277 RepID=A0A5D2QM34_GOSTO|nr:hypothetical protein ES332_A05G333100v1 [Gossypium tomentosum]